MSKSWHNPWLSELRPLLVLVAGLFLPQMITAAPGSPDLPPELQSRLQRYHNSDDLENWIYDQVQWVAQQPGSRSRQLVTAVSEAWRPPRTDEESQAWLDLLVNEGYALLRAGDIVRSTDAYTAAWQWARSHPKITDDRLLLNNILKPLGNNYTRLGDYEAADFIHQKALVIAFNLGDKEALAGEYSNLANTASNRGRLDESVTYCKLGLLQVSTRSPYRGLLLSEQADALQGLDQTNAAKTSIHKAITILKAASHARPEVKDWLFVAYQQAGDIDSTSPALALQDYLAALNLAKDRKASANPLRPRETAKLYLRLGELYRRLKQRAQATNWLDRCLAILLPGKTFPTLQADNLYAENTLADLLYSRALLCSGNDPQLALTCFRLSFAAEALLRQQLITTASKETAVADTHLRHETAIETAWSAWKARGSVTYLNTILEFMESSKAQLLLDEQRQHELERNLTTPTSGDSLDSRLRILEKALVYYQEQSLQINGNDSLAAVLLAQRRQTELDLAVIRKATSKRPPEPLTAPLFARDTLPDDHTEIRSFFAGARALYQVAVNHNGIRFADRQPLGKTWDDSLLQFLHVWFEQGPNNMIGRPRDYFDQSYSVFHQLFSLHPFSPGTHYVIVPDGALDLLPIEALPTQASYRPSPANWPFVIRQNTISYAWSIRTWSNASRSSASPTGITGFFLTDNNRHLPSLKSVTREQQGITRSVPHGKWLIDTQATAAAFKNALEHAAVVHVSSHAFAGRDTGSVPRIELYDRPFYIFQLADIPTHPALVILSACRTGDGRMINGEGAQSMARAFTAAGTNGVINAWWDVHDETAARMMERIYEQLRRQKPASEAIGLAQRNLLEDTAIPYLEKLPWYWAALNYQGDTNVRVTEIYRSEPLFRNRRLWLLAVTAIIIMILIVRGRILKKFRPPG